MIARFVTRVGTLGVVAILVLAGLAIGLGGGLVEHFRLTSDQEQQQGDQTGGQSDSQSGSQSGSQSENQSGSKSENESDTQAGSQTGSEARQGNDNTESQQGQQN